MGNRVEVTDGREHTTKYAYNPLGWLTSVTDPLYNTSSYTYDLNGNQVRQTSPKNLVTTLKYDELNRLVERIDSLGNSTKYGYDPVGNRLQMLDPRGSLWQYQYYPDNLLKQLNISGSDGSTYHVEYTYDAAGNRTQVKDDGNINNYTYDPLNRVTGAERNFDGASYRTGYQYTKALLTGIRYPGSTSLLEYHYDNFNRISEVVGFTKPQGITYYTDDAVQNITYINGVATSFTYDNNRRLQDLASGTLDQSILKQHYKYDATNNITNINDKLYEYDANNQLTKAITPGKFLETKITPGSPGVVVGDYLGSSNLYFGGDPQAVVKLDYDSSSIGIDFGGIAPGVKKILLVPDQMHQAHRITEGTFDIYHSNDNAIYTVIPRDQWEFAKDAKGVITVTFKQKLATRYLKIHVLFDHRDPLFKPKDKATFLNTFSKMLQIYQESDSRTEEYAYDSDGNRKFSRITLIQATENESLYYDNSDRLKTDGKYLYTYDNAGNLVSKERTNLQEGETAEKWQYQYDLLNRLIRVTKNGTIVSEYEYDPEGLRVVKKAKGQTIHYVFEGTEPIFEKNVTTGKTKSYVYALGKHLARVDGTIGDPDAKVYWYTTDHLGSVKAVTDTTGKVVFQADHLAFGQRYNESGDFDEWHSFTGKEYDPETGLYYFNARWYDAETGRFISEDPVGDPNNPNLYSYCGNNPLTRIDPTGTKSTEAGTPDEFGDLPDPDDVANLPKNPDNGNPGPGNPGGNNNPRGTDPGPTTKEGPNPGGAPPVTLAGEIPIKSVKLGPGVKAEVSVTITDSKVKGEFTITLKGDGTVAKITDKNGNTVALDSYRGKIISETISIAKITGTDIKSGSKMHLEVKINVTKTGNIGLFSATFETKFGQKAKVELCIDSQKMQKGLEGARVALTSGVLFGEMVASRAGQLANAMAYSFAGMLMNSPDSPFYFPLTNSKPQSI